MTISNPNKYSEMGNAALGDIRDDEDFPHVGIIKALSVGLGQNYAFGGYNASSITDTSVTFAGGKVMRDGKLVTTTGATLTISQASTGTGDSYYLAVIPDGSDSSDTADTITKRSPSKRGVTPAITSGDIIVAVMVYTGTNPMTLQYLTVNKTENHLSIATDSSGYTEVLKLEATGTTTATITGAALTDISTLDSANDRLLVRDATNNQLKLVAPNNVGSSDTPAIVDNSGTPALASGITETEVRALLNVEDSDFVSAVEAEPTLALTGDVTIAANKGLTVDTNTLHVDATNNRVGIGTTSPSQELDVSGDIRLSGEIEINGNLNHDGSNVGFYGTTPASQQSVGNLAATNIAPIPPTNPSAPQGFEPTNEAYLLGLEYDIGDIRTKLDTLIDALQLIGIIT